MHILVIYNWRSQRSKQWLQPWNSKIFIKGSQQLQEVTSFNRTKWLLNFFYSCQFLFCLTRKRRQQHVRAAAAGPTERCRARHFTFETFITMNNKIWRGLLLPLLHLKHFQDANHAEQREATYRLRWRHCNLLGEQRELLQGLQMARNSRQLLQAIISQIPLNQLAGVASRKIFNHKSVHWVTHPRTHPGSVPAHRGAAGISSLSLTCLGREELGGGGGARLVEVVVVVVVVVAVQQHQQVGQQWEVPLASRTESAGQNCVWVRMATDSSASS